MTYSDASLGSPFIDPLLVVNGAEDRLQVVLGRRPAAGAAHALLYAQEWVVPGQAARYLAPAIAQACAAAGLAPAELSVLACVRGPGGFTGLRLVLSTALGLSRACDIPLSGLEYLPLLAARPADQLVAMREILTHEGGGSVFAITHARHGQVYVQGFVPEASAWCGVRPLAAARAVDLATAAVIAAAGPGPRLACGSGARRNEAFFLTQWSGRVVILDAGFDHALPSTLLAAASRRVDECKFSLDPIDPLYIRPSDAEENLPEIARKSGMDVAAATELFAALTSQ